MGFGALSYPLHTTYSTAMSIHNMLLTTLTCQSLHEKLGFALPEHKAVFSQQHLILSKIESVPQPGLLGASFRGGETPFPTNVEHVHQVKRNQEKAGNE